MFVTVSNKLSFVGLPNSYACSNGFVGFSLPTAGPGNGPPKFASNSGIPFVYDGSYNVIDYNYASYVRNPDFYYNVDYVNLTPVENDAPNNDIN